MGKISKELQERLENAEKDGYEHGLIERARQKGYKKGLDDGRDKEDD